MRIRVSCIRYKTDEFVNQTADVVPDVPTERGQVKFALEIIRVSLRVVPDAISTNIDGENDTDPFVFANWTEATTSGDLNMLLVRGRLPEEDCRI